MGKLTVLHINIIGAIVAIIVAVALYFTIITNGQEAVKKSESEYNGVHDRAVKLDQNKKLEAAAIKDKAATEADWRVYDSSRMPFLGYRKDRITTMMNVWWPNHGKSWPERFIRGFRAHMAQEARINKVRWVNPDVLTFPSYGPDPNSIDLGGERKTLHFGPYAMVVSGRNYQSLIRHTQDWNNLRGFGVPVVEGVTLNGNSPNLQVAYNVMFTVMVKDQIPPLDGRVGGSSGGGGMMGGPMGGGRPGGMSMGPMGPGPGAMGGPPGGMSRPMAQGAATPGGGGGKGGGGGGASRAQME